MLSARTPAVRKLVCAALLAALTVNAHAGALADGFAIAGELYAASLVGGGSPRPARADTASGAQGCGCRTAAAADADVDAEPARAGPHRAAPAPRAAPSGRRCAGPARDPPAAAGDRNAQARADAP